MLNINSERKTMQDGKGTTYYAFINEPTGDMCIETWDGFRVVITVGDGRFILHTLNGLPRCYMELHTAVSDAMSLCRQSAHWRSDRELRKRMVDFIENLGGE